MKNRIQDYLYKLLDKIKKNKIPFIVFSIIWIATIVITLSIYKTSLGMKSSGNDNLANRESNVVAVSKNSSIEEIVEFDKDVESISIKFATYARKNKGNVFVKAIGEKSKTVYLDESLNVSNIQDNAFTTFGINSRNDKNERVIISITSDSEDDSCIGIYFSFEKAFDNSIFIINDEQTEGDLKVRFLSKNETLNKFSVMIITFSIISFTLIILLVLLCDKYEIIFATGALLIGLIFMIIITPMSPPDEQTHYEYTFQMSNYVLGQGDKHLKMDEAYQDYGNFAGHINVSSAYLGFMDDINKPLKLKNKNATMMSDVLESTYYLCYIPQTIGVVIGRIFKLNMLKTFYLGRLCNLLFYVACVYFALKRTPIHKFLFGVIAIMPMLLQQAASYSYDTFLNGLMLVVISFFLDWMFTDKTISNKEILTLFIVTLFVTPLKVIYSMFVLAFWFIPYTKFGSKKKKIYSLGLICLPIVIQLIVLLMPSVEKLISEAKENKEAVEAVKNTSNNVIESISPAAEVIEGTAQEVVETPTEIFSVDDDRSYYTISYAVSHLKETIDLFYNSIRFNIKIWFYEAIGRTLSGVSLIIPLTYVHILTGVLVASAFRKEPFVLSLPIKGYFVLVCIGIGILAMLGMMITWTKVGDTFIQGIQGRYFSPLLFYFMTIFNNKKIYYPVKLDKYILFTQLIVIFEVIIYVLSYTFVN